MLGASAAGALMALVDPAIRAGAWAQGSDAPEKKEVKVGFIPLTDCASVVVASVMEFDKKYGIKIVPSKEASWAAVRDKLVNGELDAAHVLYGLIYGVQMGIGGPKKDMAILMSLNHNGQAITLSNQLKDKGAIDGPKLKALIDREKREYTFAQTFPTGTHAMWIYYWLAAQRHSSVQRRQDASSCRRRRWSPTCASATWTASASASRGTTARSTTRSASRPRRRRACGRTIPRRRSARPREFVQKNPNTARAMTAAVLDAGKYIDVMANRKKVSEIIADKSYVNCPVDIIDQRLEGNYDNGIGKQWKDPDYMKFYNDGYVNFPFLSDGMWFLTQHKRWGLLKDDPGLPRRRAERSTRSTCTSRPPR